MRSYTATRVESTHRSTVLALLSVVVPLALGTACATGPAPVVTPELASCQQPTVTLVETESPSLQQQGDITIIAAASVPVCENLVRVTYSPTDYSPGGLAGVSNALSRLSGDESDVETFYERSEARGLYVRGDLDVLITIINQSPRVFRADGMVVQYQVDGNVAALDQQRYATVLNTVVLPGQQNQVAIPGIGINDLRQGAAIALYLFDVVVERDDAGNATRRGNFEWFYQLDHDTVTGPGSTTTCNWLTTRVPGSGIPDPRFWSEQDEADELACSNQG